MEIINMKEKLYTIPLNDAVNENDECPFCFIERKLEQDMINFVLGSSSSYMESDIREQTDKIGFCRTHMKKMFDYGNTLGNSLILKTHYQKLQKEFQEQIKHFTPGKVSLADRLRKQSSGNNSIAAWAPKKIAPAMSATDCRKISTVTWRPFFICTQRILPSMTRS